MLPAFFKGGGSLLLLSVMWRGDLPEVTEGSEALERVWRVMVGVGERW